MIISPPEGIDGQPINIDNVDSLSFTECSLEQKVDPHAWLRYQMSDINEGSSCSDYTFLDETAPTILFVLPTGSYKWTTTKDNEPVLQRLYDSIRLNTYTTKHI